MTKQLRQPIPSVLVNELTNAGWTRRDAEALELVRTALLRVHDRSNLRTWADRAARALSREPVLAGAIHRFAGKEYTAHAAWALYRVAPEDQRAGLAKLCAAAHQIESPFERGYDEGWASRSD